MGDEDEEDVRKGVPALLFVYHVFYFSQPHSTLDTITAYTTCFLSVPCCMLYWYPPWLPRMFRMTTSISLRFRRQMDPRYIASVPSRCLQYKFTLSSSRFELDAVFSSARYA